MANTYTVFYETGAQKALAKMDKTQANIIMAWVNKNLENTTNPRLHGKPLQTSHTGKWRYRVGDYRLIANISDDTVTILILDIGHRSSVYA